MNGHLAELIFNSLAWQLHKRHDQLIYGWITSGYTDTHAAAHRLYIQVFFYRSEDSAGNFEQVILLPSYERNTRIGGATKERCKKVMK